MTATLETEYADNELHGRLADCPGLIARIVYDQDAGYCGAPYAESGEGIELWGERDRRRDGLDVDREVSPLIACPTCEDGSGEFKFPEGWDHCPKCEGYGEIRPETLDDLRIGWDVAAVLPVDLGGRYSRIRETDIADADAFMVYSGDPSYRVEGGRRATLSLDQLHAILRGLIAETGKWMDGEVFVVIVETDPDSDAEIPPNAMDSCGGYIGLEYAEESAAEMIRDVYAAVERERAERRHWAERDVETVA